MCFSITKIFCLHYSSFKVHLSLWQYEFISIYINWKNYDPSWIKQRVTLDFMNVHTVLLLPIPELFLFGQIFSTWQFSFWEIFGQICFFNAILIEIVGFAQKSPIIWSQNIEKKYPAHNIWRFNITWVPIWYIWVGYRGKSWLWVNHYHSDHIGAFRVKRLLGLDPTAGKFQTCCPFCSNKRLLDPNFKCRKLALGCQARCTFNGKGALKRKQNLVGTVKRTNVWIEWRHWGY